MAADQRQEAFPKAQSHTSGYCASVIQAPFPLDSAPSLNRVGYNFTLSKHISKLAQISPSLPSKAAIGGKTAI